jgi:phosphoenolpyruvate carboxykinase (GTP)
MAALLEVDVEAWKAEMAAIGEYLVSYGDRTPIALEAERARVAQALGKA